MPILLRLRLMLAASTAAFVAAARPGAAQAPLPPGTYERTITAADRPPIPPLVGTWRLRLGADGRYDVTRGGRRAVTGRYGVAADTITLTDDGGPMAGRGAEATGRYRWAADSAGLVLRVLADRDVGRLAILGGGPLRRLTRDRPAVPTAGPAPYTGPIIDVHLHGEPAGPLGPLPPNPVSGRPTAVRSGEDQRRLTLAAMAERRVVLGVVSVRPNVPTGAADRSAWAAEGGARVLLGANGFDRLPGTPLPAIAALREAHRAGRLHLIGEIGAQYSGMALDDPRLEPYYALAEELDIPVGVHTGGGPPEVAQRGSPAFRMALGRPLALEDVLVRHPKLRVFLMHAGAPFYEETTALLVEYPRVYVDVSAIAWIAPREAFHGFLRTFVHGGLGDRLMFGSDGGAWVDALGLAIDNVDSAPFLTAAQKRAIFFDNAARFFRLDSARVRALTALAARPADR